MDDNQKNKMKLEMQKFIDIKINELNKSEKIAILNMIRLKVVDSLITEKNGGTTIRYSQIPYELICDIFNLIKKNIADKTKKLESV